MTHLGTVVLVLTDTHAELPEPRPVSIGTLPVWDRLGQQLEDHGYRFERYDPRSKQLPRWRGPLVVLWDFGSVTVLPRALRNVADGVVAWSLESPLVATRAYHRLGTIAEQADVVLGFSGVREILPGWAQDRFRVLRWPAELPGEITVDSEIDPQDPHRFLVMVNSNKRASAVAADVDLRQPRDSARKVAAHLLREWRRRQGSWDVPDLYEERLRAVSYFATTPGFALFGIGWDALGPSPHAPSPDLLARCYRGPAANKTVAMRDFPFALCIENTAFPGYVTEKIFDAMRAGCVPVYLGAPDAEEHLPPGAYVDVRQFESYRDMETHLRRMSISDYQRIKRQIADSLPELDQRYGPAQFVSAFENAVFDTLCRPFRKPEDK